MKRRVKMAETKTRYETILRTPPPNDPRPPRAATAIELTTTTTDRRIWDPDFGRQGEDERSSRETSTGELHGSQTIGTVCYPLSASVRPERIIR